jgi:lon-related putative ATP-dependent protease
MRSELAVEKLRHTFDPQALSCQSSQEMKPTEAIIGQERAVRALHFGLGIRSYGFNIFVAGPPGTGRTTAAKRFLEQLAVEKPVPSDWCYVNNFRDSYHPKALCLPAGRAKTFQSDMAQLVEEAKVEIRRALESDEYIAKREETVKAFQRQRDELFNEINKLAQDQGFIIRTTRIGLLTIPLKDGKPLGDEEFMALPQEEKDAISEKRETLQDELKAFVRQARNLEKGLNEELQNLDQEVALFTLRPLFEELKENYQDLPEIVDHLEDIKNDFLDNLEQFGEESEEQSPLPAGMKRSPFRKYEVNVLVDNSALEGAPVVIEVNPSHGNLFGQIEKEAQFGALVTDFTLIRSGCIHRANGGYLVLPIEETVRSPFAWETLKRALKNEAIVIEEPGERYGFITTKSLSPEPIPLDIKVILIGQPMTYQLLYSYDEDFRELFKVKADFDTVMERTDESIDDYITFICNLCESEGLLHLDSSALSRLIEQGSRLARDQRKLTARFGELSDIIREAHYYASQEEAKHINASHIKKSIDERFYRSSLIQEKVMEMIERGSIIIDVEGHKVGQVNGLSVLGLGDLTFGRPNRITASVALGQEGIIDIERVAKLGGPIHTKGVMILAGYLANRFAQDKPLSLSARLVFEQSYSGVEGDSASSTELYAILSTLSDLPIKQGIAVTGSVNQKGEVQAIGGVNEKIEGYFEVCRAKGLTGEQGVLIPESNVQHLMLKDEVVQAVHEGKFHVWAVRTIDEGIEILTGVEAGQIGEDGNYGEGTVNHRVNERLRQLAEAIRKFGKPEKKKVRSEEEVVEETPTDEPPEEEPGDEGPSKEKTP